MGGVDEAMEDDNDVYEEDKPIDSEEEDGEDLLENMEQDYEKKDELDRYEADGLDDEDQEELGYEQRRLIDRQLDQDHRMKARNKSRMPGAFFDEEMNGEHSEDELARAMRLERMKQ
jgi:DNA replication licensing factor MCM2